MTTENDAAPQPAPIDLPALRRLAEAATPGPWILNDRHGAGRVESEHDHGVVNDGWILAELSGPDGKRNGRLIAASRTAVPAALNEIDRLEDAYRGAVDMAEALRAALSAAESRATTAERRLKFNESWQIHDDSIKFMLSRYDAALDAGTVKPLHLEDAVTDIRQLALRLDQEKARAVAAEAEVARVKARLEKAEPVLAAAVHAAKFRRCAAALMDGTTLSTIGGSSEGMRAASALCVAVAAWTAESAAQATKQGGHGKA